MRVVVCRVQWVSSQRAFAFNEDLGEPGLQLLSMAMVGCEVISLILHCSYHEHDNEFSHTVGWAVQDTEQE
jgi:hypothetical protein